MVFKFLSLTSNHRNSDKSFYFKSNKVRHGRIKNFFSLFQTVWFFVVFLQF